MRTLLVRCCCAAAIAISAATFFTPTPAQAWGYRHYGYYRPYAYVYRPYFYAYRPFYRPYFYAYRPFYRPYYAYRPYRAYAYAGFGPRIWIGWGRRWW